MGGRCRAEPQRWAADQSYSGDREQEACTPKLGHPRSLWPRARPSTAPTLMFS